MLHGSSGREDLRRLSLNFPGPTLPAEEPRARELCLESVEAQSDAAKCETMSDPIVLRCGDGVAEETREMMGGQSWYPRQCSTRSCVQLASCVLIGVYWTNWSSSSVVLVQWDIEEEAASPSA